jgi:hypothetical protein
MLSVSNCAKCNGSMFKIVEQIPTGSNFKLNFVQCSSCNTPIGVLEFLNIGAQTDIIQKAIVALDARLSNIENALNQIGHVLNQRR